MAKAANEGSISDAIRPADYRGSVMLIRTIPAKKEKIASMNGEIGDIWGKVEGKKVHKEAGKFFAKLDKREDIERAQILRDLMKLVDAAGWDVTAQDLVDIAENPVEDKPKARGKKPEADEPDDEKESDPSDNKVADFKEAQKRVRKVLGVATVSEETEA